MSGTRRCVPAYMVPGRTPEIWLMRTAALPSGTTRMLFAASEQRAAAATSLATAAHRTAGRDLSICSRAGTLPVEVAVVVDVVDVGEADASPPASPPALSAGAFFGLSHLPTWKIRKMS